MTPEPWNPDDLSDEEYAAWEAEREAEWLANPEREFCEEMWAMAADNLAIPHWGEDSYRTRLAIALWRIERGRQLDGRDLDALAQSARADLSGKATPRPRGRQAVQVSPRLLRKRQLQAAYLRGQGLPLEVVAAMMGTGVEARDVPALVAGAGGLVFAVSPDLDAELMAEILAEHKTR